MVWAQPLASHLSLLSPTPLHSLCISQMSAVLSTSALPTSSWACSLVLFLYTFSLQAALNGSSNPDTMIWLHLSSSLKELMVTCPWISLTRAGCLPKSTGDEGRVASLSQGHQQSNKPLASLVHLAMCVHVSMCMCVRVRVSVYVCLRKQISGYWIRVSNWKNY